MIYPQRTRCKECRKKLETTVLKGVYCSYRCAGKPAISTKVADAPRSCKREVKGVWEFKKRYRHVGEVPLNLQEDPATNIYECPHCLFLHVGHSRVPEMHQEKLRRTVYDMKTLGSVIQRRREQLDWDKKRLAADLKVRPIRITEIEAGDPASDVVVMFKLLARLKIIVELIER